MTFEEFYDEVLKLIRQAGFERTPDRGTVQFDMEQGWTPKKSAKAFIKDWQN